ncbi:class I SAM-dependent methyltransferase [Candidatus Kaiserbacteria bacterium]|nr:class I SAM-dependent methyltransferase [Candidatus Kaiserbacteria bacterium]
MDDDITKSNYETSNDWHVQKSLAHSWAKQLDTFLRFGGFKPTKVLDAGCGGSGRDIQQFRERGIQVEGFDYSHAAIESLRKQFPDGKFYEGNLLNTGLTDETYDGIWACASIPNLKRNEVYKTLAEFWRILTPRGKLFISVKEGEGERMVPDAAGERFFSFYSEMELQNVVEKAGFKVDHTEIIPYTWNTWTTKEEGTTLPNWVCLYALKS